MARMTFNVLSLSLNLYLSGYTFLLLKQVNKFVPQWKQALLSILTKLEKYNCKPNNSLSSFLEILKKIKKNGLLTSAKHLNQL